MADLSLSRLSGRTQLLLVVGLALAGLATYFYMYDVPWQQALAARASERDTLRARVTAGQATARRLEAFRADVATLEGRLDELRTVLPEEKDVAELLRRIQTLATESSLTIRGFKPAAITTRALHAEWPIGLELEGTYHNFGLFLDRVSRLPRIINVGAITMTPRTPAAPGASVNVSCTATTFVLLDPAAVPPPAAPVGRASR